MKTNNELLILGIKARQKQLRDLFYSLSMNTNIDSNTELNQLVLYQKEHQQLEHQLSQIDPTYNEIPF